MKGKRIYRKPFMVKDNFLPQEYCAPCDKLLTDLHTNGIYLDWYPYGTNGYYDYGSEYMNTYGKLSGNPSDGVYKGVQTYKLLYSPYSTGSINTNVAYELTHSHDYTTSSSGFTVEGSSNRFKFSKLKVVDIKIKNSHVYYNLS